MLAVQMVLTRNDATILDLTLNIRRKVILALGSSLLSIGTVLSITYPRLVKTLLGASTRLSWLHLARQWSVTLVLFVATAYAGERVLLTSWIRWGLAGIVATVALVGVCWVCGLSGTERGKLQGRVLTLASGARSRAS